MQSANTSYKPVWQFISNTLDNSNGFFSSTAIISYESFVRELQVLETHLINDLGGTSSCQYQQVRPILDEIEKANKPHPIFRKTVWVNKERISESLSQIIIATPRHLWTEFEQDTPEPEHQLQKPQFDSPLGKALYAVLTLGMLVFLVVVTLYGTEGQRRQSIFVIVLGVVGLLNKANIIKDQWVDRSSWIVFAAMCIGGPMFALFLAGKHFGWW